MERYISNADGSLYSTSELLAKLFNGFNEDVNILAINSDFTYIEDIDMQNSTYNIYCIRNDETRLASKVFLSFHEHRTLLGKTKYIVAVNMSHDQNQYPYKIFKKLPSLIKKRANKIKELPEFKGLIKSIKA